MRRAATSIALNIAEGAGAGSNAEFRRFLSYALRSTYEVMTALEISHRLSYSSSEKTKELLDEADQIAAMIVGLSRSLV
jgi:four helix bundle protein